MRMLIIWFSILFMSSTLAADTPDDPCQGHPCYLQIIVKACIKPDGPPATCDPAVQGDCLPTIDQNEITPQPTTCIDVPIPSQVLSPDMTFEMCKGINGYIASMQYLKSAYKDYEVGGWSCLLLASPPKGAVPS